VVLQVLAEVDNLLEDGSLDVGQGNLLIGAVVDETLNKDGFFGDLGSGLWHGLWWQHGCMEPLFLVVVFDCCRFDREGVPFTSQKLIYSFVHQLLVVSFVDIFSVKCCSSI